MRDLRQSHHYARFMSQKGWAALKIPPASEHVSAGGFSPIVAYIKQLPLFPFSVMKVQRFELLPNFDAVERIALKHRVFSITLEPGFIKGMTSSQLDTLMRQHGYRGSRSPLLPTKTLHVDLTGSQKDLLQGMKKDARTSIRKAQHVSHRQILGRDDAALLERFHEFWRKHGKGYVPSLSEFSLLVRTFDKDAFVVLISSKDAQLLAGATILISDGCAYYYYAVTSQTGRRLYAGYLAVWEAMLEAKRRSCRIFDFEGIYDDRFKQLKRWRGFSAFKQKFGGEEVCYPGPFSRSFFPFKIQSLFHSR